MKKDFPKKDSASKGSGSTTAAKTPASSSATPHVSSFLSGDLKDKQEGVQEEHKGELMKCYGYVEG